MPVPKRKTSRSRRDMRQSTKFLRPQAMTACSQCREPNLPHQVCETCGYYKGRKVLTTKHERNERRQQERKVVADKQSLRAKVEPDDHAGHDHADHQ